MFMNAAAAAAASAAVPRFEGEFENAHLYAQLYSRNNKKQAHKNIRCFPLCSQVGHMEKGFCGQPIVFHLNANSFPSSSTILAWGEIRCLDESSRSDAESEESVLAIDVGSVFAHNALLLHTKDPKTSKTDSLDKPLYEGVLRKHAKPGYITFAFNEQKKGWSYNWQSSKHVTMARHAFCVYLFAPSSSNNELICVSVHEAPFFLLYSRKKREWGGVGPRNQNELVQLKWQAKEAKFAIGARSNHEEEEEEEEEEEAPVKRVKSAEASDGSSSNNTFAFSTCVYPTMASPVLAIASNSSSHFPAATSMVEEEEEDAVDMEMPQQLESNAAMRRVELVLHAVFRQLTQTSSNRSGNADFFDMKQQLSLDWFIEEGGGGAKSPDVYRADNAAAGRGRREEDNVLIAQLANYLVEESSLTTSVRRIVDCNYDGPRRRQALIKICQDELTAFLTARGKTEQDLDVALFHGSSIASTESSLSVLDKHLAQVSAMQQELVRAMIPPAAAWASFSSALRTLPSEFDISGHWYLDENLREAYDECRARRGVPEMVRKMISITETNVHLLHTVDKIILGVTSKLFSSPEEVFETDGVERALHRALPIPWSNPDLQGETYSTWLDSTGAVNKNRTYGGRIRTHTKICRELETDRLVFDVHYLERIDAETEQEQEEWRCLFAKRGFAIRLPPTAAAAQVEEKAL